MSLHVYMYYLVTSHAYLVSSPGYLLTALVNLLAVVIVLFADRGCHGVSGNEVDFSILTGLDHWLYTFLLVWLDQCLYTFHLVDLPIGLLPMYISSSWFATCDSTGSLVLYRLVAVGYFQPENYSRAWATFVAWEISAKQWTTKLAKP